MIQVWRHRKPRRTESDLDHLLGDGHVAALDYEPAAVVVAHVASETGLDEDDAAALLLDVRRMAVARTLSDRRVVPSAIVDSAWHSWMLETADYRVFGETLGGYQHHDPQPSVASHDEYLSTIELLERLFGPLDMRFWPQI
jgi:hypothetical protein